MKAAGFGTLEAMVAVALFALIASAVTSTLVLARRLQTDVAAERGATQLAVAGLERLRAGDAPRPSQTTRGFTLVEAVQPWGANALLLEAQVRVSWQGDTPHVLELKTLMAR